MPAIGWAQIFLFAGLLDFGYLQYDPSRAPGDYKNAGARHLAALNVHSSQEDFELRVHERWASYLVLLRLGTLEYSWQANTPVYFFGFDVTRMYLFWR